MASAGSSNIAVTWTGSVDNISLGVEEYSAGTGSTWSLDTDGTASSPMPALSTQGPGELYFGAAMAWWDAAAGSAPGVTYNVPDDQFLLAWDTNTSGTLAPTGTGAGSVAALFIATGYSAPAPTVTTSNVYDADNRLVSTTVDPGTPTSSTTLSYYDPDGNVYCSVSANAYASGTYACPAWQASWANNPAAVGSLYTGVPATSPASEVTTSFYDPDGDLVQQSGPDEATTISAYNPNGQVICAEDAADMAATLAAGPTASYPYGCPTTPLTSPPATGSNPGFESSFYNADGALLSSTDAAGDTSSYTYDPDGQVLTQTGPNGQVTTNCYYWEASSCASSAPSGGGDATALYSTTSPPAADAPSGATTTYAYWPGGATYTATTAAGQTTDYYDVAGDLNWVSYTGAASGYEAASSFGYSYTPGGLRSAMSDGTGTTTYNYDNNDDLLSAAFVTDSGLASGTIYYTYYSNGQRESLTYPVAPSGGTATVTMSYNGNGQLSSETDWAGNTVAFTDDADGNTADVAYPNGTFVGASYDLGDAETALEAATGTPSSPGAGLLGINYDIDGAEQATGETDTGAISSSSGYGYDSADRLGSVTVGGGSPATEVYDASGDPKTLAGGDTQTFSADGQVLTTETPGASIQSYGYNPTGDRTGSSGAIGPTATYAYDQADRLAGATVGPVTASYSYDGDSLLSGVTTSSGTATDFWDAASGLPLLLSDGTNDYLYGPQGTPVEQASIASGTPEYFVSDRTGSTRALLGVSGAVTATYTFDVYGNVTAASGTASTPLLYDGQYKDPVSGFYYLRARWYDSETAEFATLDPDVAQTRDPYVYSGDDPVNSGDPSGLASVPSSAVTAAGPCMPPALRISWWLWSPSQVSNHPSFPRASTRATTVFGKSLCHSTIVIALI